ncbi:MAG: helix-turn-helix domain-containing protein [bacterium]|nr:helix-turn-helix domain-containing protein [bacterium]
MENPTALDESIRIIQEEVETQTGVSVEDMKAKTRKAEVVEARHIAMYLCITLLDHASLKKVGAAFGKRDHSTVIHAHESVSNRKDLEPKFQAMVGSISLRVREKLPKGALRLVA